MWNKAMGVLSVLATSLSSYLFVSLSLLYYPNILHKPKKTKKCCHISHRGGAGEGYENTLSAFNRCIVVLRVSKLMTHWMFAIVFYSALNHGTEMLELDCHLTKDKHVVVVHDSCLQRLTGESLKVEECDYGQLPPLKTTLNIDFDPGRKAYVSFTWGIDVLTYVIDCVGFQRIPSLDHLIWVQGKYLFWKKFSRLSRTLKLILMLKTEVTHFYRT